MPKFETNIYWPFKITRHPFTGRPLYISWVVHELTQFINNETKLWPCEKDVL